MLPVALKVKKKVAWLLVSPCTAEFKLPAGVSTDRSGFVSTAMQDLITTVCVPTTSNFMKAATVRKLVVPSVPIIRRVRLPQAVAAGAGKNYEVAATVVAMHTQGILIGDASGVMLAFLGEAPAVAVNDAVTVKGTTGIAEWRHSVRQGRVFRSPRPARAHNTPAPRGDGRHGCHGLYRNGLGKIRLYKYVKYNGEFTVSGNYYNVVIAGTTTKGSVAYGKSEWASFNGKPVTVEGWLLGGTANYLQTMVTSVTVDSSTPIVEISAPQQFAATSPVAQTLNYTVTNTTASAVTFAIGTNADKFSLGTKTDNTIVVSAKGDNTRIRQPICGQSWLPKLPVRRLQRLLLKQAAPAA